MTFYLAYKLPLVQHSVGHKITWESVPEQSPQASEAEDKDLAVSNTETIQGYHFLRFVF
jgi:hypothetical protein